MWEVACSLHLCIVIQARDCMIRASTESMDSSKRLFRGTKVGRISFASELLKELTYNVSSGCCVTYSVECR